MNMSKIKVLFVKGSNRLSPVPMTKFKIWVVDGKRYFMTKPLRAVVVFLN